MPSWNNTFFLELLLITLGHCVAPTSRNFMSITFMCNYIQSIYDGLNNFLWFPQNNEANFLHNSFCFKLWTKMRSLAIKQARSICKQQKNFMCYLMSSVGFRFKSPNVEEALLKLRQSIFCFIILRVHNKSSIPKLSETHSNNLSRT